MAIVSPLQPVIHLARIADLRPTQFTVGMEEVEHKRRAWRALPRSATGEFLGAHMVPAVLGPGRRPWLVDHHHLVLALHLEGVDEVMLSVIAHLQHLPKRRFMAFLDCHNWLHPYDTKGERRDWKDLPKHIGGLKDDPYRSLAGEVRRAGGYAKSAVPYAEFLWADYFRDRIKPHVVEEHFAKALTRALALAADRAARHLPGWAGPEED